MTNHEMSQLQLPADPIDGLLQWLSEAEAAKIPEPNAMTLATVSVVGQPSARIVLFKGISTNDEGRRGPRFFTNYESRKSHEIELNPRVALVFHWAIQQRQIRLEGRLEKVSYEESDAYFQSRDRGSRLGAWASPQSQLIPDRASLVQRVEEMEKKFGSGPILCPPFWGGWRLVPARIEFWQGVQNRLHDRFLFQWNGTAWDLSRLAP